MPVQQRTKDKQMRQRIANEAARILAESGRSDYQAAKRKAAERLGAPETRNLPSNTEIEQALVEHHRLFNGDTQPARLRQLREAALEAMRFFEPFHPLLVGPVLSGTAGLHAEVQLHVFAGSPEEIAFFLMDWHVPYEEGQRRLRFGREDYLERPTYRFVAGDVSVEVTVFPSEGLRKPPLSPVDGRPMQRGNLETVQALIEQA